MDAHASPRAAGKPINQLSGDRVTVAPKTCPRCGQPVLARATGRPATWCSQSCRRAAYEERRAAARGAIAVRVVERVDTVEHDLPECVRRVTASSASCRRVLLALAELAHDGELTSDPKWDSTLTAFRGLAGAILRTHQHPAAAPMVSSPPAFVRMPDEPDGLPYTAARCSRQACSTEASVG